MVCWHNKIVNLKEAIKSQEMNSALLLFVLLALIAMLAPSMVQATDSPTISPTREPSIKPTANPSRNPTRRPTAPTRSPSRRPTGKPSAAKFWYKTTEGEANFNIAFAAVFGSLGAIAWGIVLFYKLQHEYVVHKKRQYITKRASILSSQGKEIAEDGSKDELHIELVPIEPAGSNF